MGWSIGFDPGWRRDIGYGVPALCDHPDCTTGIDRGLSYVCGNAPYGGDNGCGLYFCDRHLASVWDDEGEEVILASNGEELHQLCERCIDRHTTGEAEPFEPKADVLEWVKWKLSDESWQQWRDKNPQEVQELVEALHARRI